MSSTKAAEMAQALTRLLADPEVNVDGKYDSCSSQIGEVISAEVDIFVTEKNDDAEEKNKKATEKAEEDNEKDSETDAKNKEKKED